QGRLAAPRGTEQGDEFARTDPEPQTLEYVRLAEPLRDVLDVEVGVGQAAISLSQRSTHALRFSAMLAQSGTKTSTLGIPAGIGTVVLVGTAAAASARIFW